MTEQLHFHFSLSCIGEGNGNPLQCSCLENHRDRGAWWAAVYGVAQSRTRLKRLSRSSSSSNKQLFTFSISSYFSLGRLYVSRIFPFILGYPICCCIILHISLLWSLVFLLLVISVVILFMILFILDFFLFFLNECS